MAGIDNNLYPPIFNKSVIPAFIYNQPCRIYFAISHFNNIDEIDQRVVQVSIKNQKTNQSVFAQKYAPCGILLAVLHEDGSVSGSARYYVDIDNTSFERKQLELNQYYQVQIRFTQAGKVTLPQKSIITASWINENLSFFSEWSKTVLIRGIDFPIIELEKFNNIKYFHNLQGDQVDFKSEQEEDNDESLTSNVKNNQIKEQSDDNSPSIDVTDENVTHFVIFEPNIHGRIYFKSNEEEERVQSYNISLINFSGQQIENSGNIFPNEYNSNNEINYTIRSDLSMNSVYALKISITTENQFSVSRIYFFLIEDSDLYNIKNKLYIRKDNLNGRAILQIDSPDMSVRTLNEAYEISRSSSDEDFKYWDIVYQISIENPESFTFPVTVYDNTLQPGVFYKYRLQKVDSQGFRSNFVAPSETIMIQPQDCYLYGQGKALRIRFDPKVTNFSHTVSETKVETIGSKYPFIYRNANINYKTFTISGLIVSLMDPMNMFHASRIDLYGDNWEKYQNYNYSNNIDIMHDYIYQKKFRDEVIDFLYENNVKLFKSTTEGNVLVKLSNITLEPKNELGRFIYSFSATAYQVADAKKFENYSLYGIQDKGKIDIQTSYTTDRYGQYFLPDDTILYVTRKNYKQELYSETTGNQISFNKNTNIVKSIQNKMVEKYPRTFDISVLYLRYLKIEMTCQPYFIGEKNGILERVTINSKTENNEKILTQGYLVEINGNRIIINKYGFYELTDFNMQIKTLRFLYGESASLSYVARIKVEDKNTNIIVKMQRQKVVGQYWGAATAGRSFWSWISKKYKKTTYKKKKVASQQRVDRIRGVRIYAPPGTVFSVAEGAKGGAEEDLTAENVIINETGMIEFFDDLTDVSTIMYNGVTLGIRYPQENQSPENVKINYLKQCVFTGKSVTDLYKIENPIPNGIYNLIRDPKNKILNIPYNLASITKILETKADYYLNAYHASIQNATAGQIANYQKMLNLGLEYYVTNLDDLQTMYFIYYEKDWYPVVIQNNACILGIDSTEIIVDYFCDIIRQEYKV